MGHASHGELRGQSDRGDGLSMSCQPSVDVLTAVTGKRGAPRRASAERPGRDVQAAQLLHGRHVQAQCLRASSKATPAVTVALANNNSTITVADGGCDARHKCGTTSVISAVERSGQRLTRCRSPTSTTSAKCTRLSAKSSGEWTNMVKRHRVDALSRDGKLDNFEVPETSTVQQAEDLPTHDE